ncbi:HD-GYP domain-containing protein [Paenibacillus marinisediminis]
MVMIPLAQVNPGERLAQDVYSVLGGLLMSKNRVLSNRDLEVLDAFMIHQLEIERNTDKEQASARTNPSKDEGSLPAVNLQQVSEEERIFLEIWMELASHVDKMMGTSAVIRIPIFELRSLLEKLIVHIKQFHPMAVRSQLHEHLNKDMSNYLIHKSIAVALTSYLIGQWIDMPPKEGMQIALAGLLHDIGKIKLDDDVLNKRDTLTPNEQLEIKRHTQFGYEILRNTPALNDGVKLAALQHHERIDGQGYPLRISGEKIHVYAKIVAIADMFHAMTMDRVYRRAESPFLTLEKLQEASFGKLDPQMVLTFIHKMMNLTQGTVVKLSDGRVGRIVFIDNQYPTRPWVSINGTIEQLVKDKQLWIESIVAVK